MSVMGRGYLIRLNVIINYNTNCNREDFTENAHAFFIYHFRIIFNIPYCLSIPKPSWVCQWHIAFWICRGILNLNDVHNSFNKCSFLIFLNKINNSIYKFKLHSFQIQNVLISFWRTYNILKNVTKQTLWCLLC